MRTPFSPRISALLGHLGAGFLGALFIGALFVWLPELHELDMRISARLMAGEQARLNADLVIVDVPKGKDMMAFRRQLGSLLRELALDSSDQPRAVALDLWFDGDIPGQEEVARGLEALHGGKRPVPVHGVLNVLEENGQLAVEDTRRHQVELYARMDSVGHNLIARGSAGPFYQPCLPTGRVAMPLHVAAPALVPRAARLRPRFVPMGPCLERTRNGQVLSYAPDLPARFTIFGGEALPTRPSFYGKVVVVGRIQEDRSPFPGRSGPEVVAWAISDLLGPSGVRGVVDSPILHLGLALAMPLAALAAFGTLLRVSRAWRLHPGRVAILAGICSLLLPAALCLALRAAGCHYTQVALPSTLTVWTLLVAVHYRSRQSERPEQFRREEDGPTHRAYDVFISYRRTHAAWVRGYLLPLFQELRHPDGSRWRIFWDNEALHSGNFNRQLEWAIHESRIFLPLLTPDYFDPKKRYCYWEMNTAYDRIPLGQMRMTLLFHAGYDPAMHGHRDFPSLAAMHGYATGDPEFPERLLRELRALDGEA